jgi:hypothetical protein
MAFIALDPPASAEVYQVLYGRADLDDLTPTLTGTDHKLYILLRVRREKGLGRARKEVPA